MTENVKCRRQGIILNIIELVSIRRVKQSNLAPLRFNKERSTNDVCGLDVGKRSREVSQFVDLHNILNPCHHTSVTISLENLVQ
jgi:hypothetical protein